MKQISILFLGGVLLAGVTSVLAYQDAPKDGASSGVTRDAVAVLKKAASALSKVKVAHYTATYSAEGWATSRVPAVTGTVVVGPKAEYDVDRFRCDVRLTPYDSKETLSYLAGCDGDVYFLSDPKSKTVYADMDPAVLGSRARDVQRVLMRRFSLAKDWMKEELEAKSGALGAEATIGGELCHRVDVKISDQERRAWFFSKSDLLPRRVDRYYMNDEGEEGLTRLVMTNLKAQTTLDLSPFKFEVPPGFKKTDDFAP